MNIALEIVSIYLLIGIGNCLKQFHQLRSVIRQELPTIRPARVVMGIIFLTTILWPVDLYDQLKVAHDFDNQ